MTGNSTSAQFWKHQVLVRVKLPAAPNSAQVHLRWERLPAARTGAQVRRFFVRSNGLSQNKILWSRKISTQILKTPRLWVLKSCTKWMRDTISAQFWKHQALGSREATSCTQRCPGTPQMGASTSCTNRCPGTALSCKKQQLVTTQHSWSRKLSTQSLKTLRLWVLNSCAKMDVGQYFCSVL